MSGGIVVRPSASTLRFWIKICEGILVMFVRHHTLVFGMDTLVTGSEILFCSQDVFIMCHGVLKLSFIDTFHIEFDLAG